MSLQPFSEAFVLAVEITELLQLHVISPKLKHAKPAEENAVAARQREPSATAFNSLIALTAPHIPKCFWSQTIVTK
jgi:hypothetical protein